MDIYAYQRPVGKIEDDPALREEFIAVFDSKSKEQAARFGLLYARRLLELTGFETRAETAAAFTAVGRWLEGKTDYNEARNISFRHLYAGETDLIKRRFYKTMAQLSCIPHVKAHALWASDMAITLINAMFPGSPEAVCEERRAQTALFKGV